MKKKLLTFLLVSIFFLLPNLSLGVERENVNRRNNPSIEKPASAPTPTAPTDESEEKINENPENLSQPTRRKIREFSEIKEQRKEEIRERSAEAKKEAERIREERAEEIQTRKDQFREKLREIREQRRRDSAERLAENINKLNGNLSSRYDGFLGAMELVLDKIEIRLGKIEEARSIDLTSTRNNISDARNLLNIARTEVISQKAKIYVVSIQSEETLRNDFKTVMEELRNDHKIIREEYIFPLRNLIREIMETLAEENEKANETKNQTE